MKKKKKLKRYRVCMDSVTTAISLVSEPAIEVEAIALEKQEEELTEVFLEKNEKYLFVSPIAIPDKDIYRNNGETEFYINFSADSIEAMQQDYMTNMRVNNVTLKHEQPIDNITLVESWIVSDPYQDKAHALGFDVPKGTWMGAFKVKNKDVWDRIKSGELKGVSVESLCHLEDYDFSKQEENVMDVENVSFKDFMSEVKTIIKDALSSEKVAEEKVDEPVEVKMEEETPKETPAEPQISPVEPPKPAEVVESTPEPKQEPTEPENKPNEEPKSDNHLEELLKNLQAEVAALKELNQGLKKQVKELEKEPSAKPVNTVAGATKGDTYSNWRDTMRNLLH